MFLLDTDLCVAHLRGQRAARLWLEAHAPDQVRVSSVTRGELLVGVHKAPKVESALAVLNLFLSPFVSLPFEDRAADQYGELRAKLERQGQKIGPHDLMIAAIARVHGLAVVTRNVREFERVPGITVAPW
ncbi:MAG: type II toxin-antitoxin system VapC family toxin [Acidobacteria bacterium]|nr:type II toxin-antitoxin system VapC family toxin [Acidobacteriota bacterium]